MNIIMTDIKQVILNKAEARAVRNLLGRMSDHAIKGLVKKDEAKLLDTIWNELTDAFEKVD